MGAAVGRAKMEIPSDWRSSPPDETHWTRPNSRGVLAQTEIPPGLAGTLDLQDLIRI